MITAEDAGARLRSIESKTWRADAAQRVRKLRRNLRPVASPFLLEPLFTIDRVERERRDSELVQAAIEMDGLSDGQLRDVMCALHPRLGPALARWWVDSQEQPYQRGWARRAFRATRSPQLTRGPRTRELVALLSALGGYDVDAPWLAAWGGHLMAGPQPANPAAIGGVLAAAIDLGGPEAEATLSTLVAVGNGEDPVGVMGRYLVVALLRSGDPGGWDYVGRLLLAAQRQEGLRQVILEAADEAQPAAFDRLLGLILDHKLLRFAAAVRAVGVWFGIELTVDDLRSVTARAESLRRYRVDENARLAAVDGGDAWETYVALCAGALRDVFRAVADADRALRRDDVNVRAAAVRFLGNTSLVRSQERLSACLEDPDATVSTLAACCLVKEGLELPQTFGRIGALLTRLPESPREVTGVGVESSAVQLSRPHVALRLIAARGNRDVSVLLRWMPMMDAGGRSQVAHAIGRESLLTPETRAVSLQLLADRSSSVRNAAVRALKDVRLDASEAETVEALLTRNATDVRRAALSLLASQPKDAALASARRLEASTNAGQRTAATELFGVLGAAASRTAPTPSTRSPRTTKAATAGGELATEPSGPALDARAKLLDEHARTPPRQPLKVKRPKLRPDRIAELIRDVDAAAVAHRDTPVTVSGWQGSKEMLLGDIQWPPSAFAPNRVPTGDDTDAVGMLLPEAFRPIFTDRPNADRTQDGLDALRAYAVLSASLQNSGRMMGFRAEPWWRDLLDDAAGATVSGTQQPRMVSHVLSWLIAETTDSQVVGECLDVLDTVLAGVPDVVLDAPPPKRQFGFAGSGWRGGWRVVLEGLPWLTVLSGTLMLKPSAFTREQLGRWFGLMRWLEQPRPGDPVRPIDRRLLLAAYEAGLATDADAVAAFFTPGDTLLRDLTRRWRGPLAERHPGLSALADRVRDRVVAAEVDRGDLPTTTSVIARNISSTSGVDLCTTLVQRMGRGTLSRGYTGSSDSRDAVLSHLIRVSFPDPSDTAADLGRAAAAKRITNSRLVDLAVYAPQWAHLVEAALAWPGLADAVLWLHAHTKDNQWSVDHEIRDAWAAMSAELTPLTAADLESGAVDVEWFHRCYLSLGAERWRSLDKAAKLASGGSGHRRAQIFAQAMLGQTSEDDLTERIRGKRQQDAVRALGLLPLPAGQADETALQRRYGVLREFERGSRAFGSQRQASEQTAVRVAVDNLARTAGYPDPQRFIWAMEALEAGDLADGPVETTVGDIIVTLSVTSAGTPDLAVRRGTKILQSVPAPLRKDEAIAELRTRKTALTRQASRVRKSLEAAMVAGDEFTPDDIAGFRRHPLLAPMLDQIIWVDSTGRTLRRVDGVAIGPEGRKNGAKGALRIAHPTDFVADGSWVSWQEQLFDDTRKQPFKQVFRELYVLTPGEQKAGPISNRYEGHQLQPRQALALLGARGWLTDRDSGDASRVFHRHGIAARLSFVDGFLTPQEADLPTIGGVYFTRRGERHAQPLHDTPPIVFSEAMRDVDLVVSVAHAGGVDPEATASTTEMRATLVRETARLLKLDNIRFAGDTHVIIKGTLGEYSVHLGSAIVHRRPGGNVCIVPVGSQHRGRLFLPFADDDPKTAEVVAKVLLLARDREVKDPTILEQLRSWMPTTPGEDP